MSRRFNKEIVTVFCENGYHKVMLPSGVVLPHAVDSVTQNGVYSSTVTITMICNVVQTKREAVKNYEINKQAKL
jgi:hypothetical protein